MSKPLIILSSLLLLAAGPTPPTPPSPRPPHDHTILFSSGASWLGVSIADVTSERAKELNMKEETGVEIKAVTPGSPAEKAGLRKEDVILEYQGTRVEGAMQLTRMVRETPPGRIVTLKALRDGEARTVRVKVSEHDGEENQKTFHRRIEIPPIEIPEIEMPDIPFLESLPSSSRLGVSVEELGEQLGDFFGVKDGEGVLIRSVRKGSPADGAGLRAGDVIVKVDGEKIDDSGDLRGALRDHRGRSFPITIVRDRREQSVTVTLPKPEEPPDEDLEDSSRDIEKSVQESVRARLEAAQSKMEAARARIEARFMARDDI
ncbi:MAG TPA: PDZ domain-containing protein [Candidatus Polarisedimenticolia bacterium]|nr:PDZ domain-containing protein [Candidatus Polarisedimenticolia bacterium]